MIQGLSGEPSLGLHDAERRHTLGQLIAVVFHVVFTAKINIKIIIIYNYNKLNNKQDKILKIKRCTLF